MAGGRAVATWVSAVLAITLLAVLSLGVIHWMGAGTAERGLATGERMPPASRRPYTFGPLVNGPDSSTAQRLNQYRWIDRDAGVVAVPVAVAMDILAVVPNALDRGASRAGGRAATHRTTRRGPP